MDRPDEVRYEQLVVQPLDRQFGVHPVVSTPESANDAVFGNLEGDATSSTYALLDAARIEGLPERLASADTPHDCLVRGETRETLGDVSPWLVELQPDTRLCRDLFTKGDAPWEIWGKEAYVLMRSHFDLAAIINHLRRFTKLRDTNGNWHFFRFQDPLVMRTLVMGLPSDARGRFLAPFLRVIVPDTNNTLHVFDPYFSSSSGP